MIYGLDPKVATLKWCPWKIDKITFMKQEIKLGKSYYQSIECIGIILWIMSFGQVVEF